MATAGALEDQELMSEGKNLSLQGCSSLKRLASRRKQRENDRHHVAEKLQRRLPKFNQFNQNGVFGRDNFSAGPSDPTSRWTPCPPKYSKRRLQVGLGCVQLSPSCPFRPLHTFRFLRPARLLTPLLGYGAPHLSARRTSTLLNNALLSAHFLFADDSPGE